MAQVDTDTALVHQYPITVTRLLDPADLAFNLLLVNIILISNTVESLGFCVLRRSLTDTDQ